VEVNFGFGLIIVYCVNTLAEERLRQKLPDGERNPYIVLLNEAAQDFGIIYEIS